VQNVEGLQEFMFGTLYHTQPCLGLILKGPERQNKRLRERGEYKKGRRETNH
jgi:hypothetical protein